MEINTLNIVINKDVWMQCFSAGVPSEVVLRQDIDHLHGRLKQFNSNNAKNSPSKQSKLHNTLQRKQKMLAAVKDGQPWAWMLYPSAFNQTT